MKRFLLAFCLVAGSITATTPAHAATIIQPGAYMGSDVGGCTMGFVFTGGGNTYVSSAAHCVSKVGADVRTEDGTTFGDVAVMGNPDSEYTDWSLIKVRAAQLPNVRAAVKGHPDMPRVGYTKSSQVSALDAIQFSGYGMVFEVAAQLREGRQGMIVDDDGETYTAIAPDIYGDSGGPITHIATGRAYGLVSRLCLGLCTSMGPTIEGIVAKAKAKGFSITLKTV